MLEQFSPDTPLLLVGCGRMGQALAAGWLARGLTSDALWVLDPACDRSALPDVPDEHWAASPDDLAAMSVPRTAVIAVKPQIMGTVLPGLAALLGLETLVISVAAGTTLASLATSLATGLSAGPASDTTGIASDAASGTTLGLSDRPRLIRAMPNTPAAVGQGMTGLVGPGCDAGDKQLAEALMGAVGKTAWIADEALMDSVTAVSGSGPAYVFYFVECLAAAARDAGLDPESADLLARQTVIGAACLMDADPSKPAATLRDEVTSPGGTTAAALDVLMAADSLAPLVRQAVRAARDRGRALAGDD